MFKRRLTQKIKDRLDNKDIIILYGARQVGKTTLLEEFLKDNPNALILNCERSLVHDIFSTKDLSQIEMLFENKKYIALDEAQNINNIGKILKLVYDELGNKYKIIATGSSSFELSNKIVEPLTGRNIKFHLYPLMISEIKEKNEWLWVKEQLNNFLLFGMYPEIIELPLLEKKEKLNALSSDYLFKDVLSHENIRNADILRLLVKAIALQIGSQVSFNELANFCKVSVNTVIKYLDLLEKTFVIFSLNSYSNNLRNEIKKSKKYYFYDLGIRNALINNFTPIQNRNDLGALWENFCISERIKLNSIKQPFTNYYFWRTYDGAEIDLIEENDGKLETFEFKWKLKGKIKLPNSFIEKYKVNKLNIVSKDNFHDYLL
ncbi:MAG: ATP-binding protein [Bacteroidota bacterium]|nr:ATP-binding protein [Bacteroidota bacterium]